MWLQMGLFGGAVVLAAMVWRTLRRPRGSTRIDVGNVSDGWLAEQRRRTDDS
jgi:hypothetical protein